MSNAEDDVPDIAAQWLAEGRTVALGTVMKTWGSAPRQAGSQIAVRDDGAFAGSVSGGCVEGVVVEQARAAMEDGRVRKLEFGVADETAWSVGLACGGRIEIFVEPIAGPRSRDIFAAIKAAKQARRSVVRAVDVLTGEDRLIGAATDGCALDKAALEAIRTDRSGCIEIEGRSWLLVVFNPPVDLAIVGAVHVAQSLAKMAAQCGHDVRVIDPRTSFAMEARFPGIGLSHEWPEEALAKRPPGLRSALVALSHDPKLDDPALSAALASPAFYIGALGSKRTHAIRLERLKAHGFSDDALARIHGPVGLVIGAKTPAEIAVSILAQITERLRVRPQ
ncbi:MAG: XdhC family protein [Alphaproteobacteria bacterium]|nr:XdhC family protein [Alphaproteobacteria bacterium]MDE2113078.1 XdhC family protein [Alphaproteobacteria bacterium]MDE2492873.1 XdhC family protein [Alphaproteobacteria bacterium]